MAGFRRAFVALAAALALADASIVALALPPILVEMDTTITGAAAVIGVYALVLAVAILPAQWLGADRAGPLGMGLFAAASVGCALAGTLPVLLAFRALQAVGGAAALLAAFRALDAGRSRGGHRLWLGAALVGTAAGPAIGGALTEAFDWRAIFLVQAPIAIVAAIACAGGPATAPAETVPEPEDARPPERLASDEALWARGEPARPAPSATAGWITPRDAAREAPRPEAPPPEPAPAPVAEPAPVGALAALAFTAASFTAVLFLLVIELVAGFAFSPLRAALGITALPLAALAAAAIPGPARARALAGAVLLAGGAAALAFLPEPTIAWTIPPQLLAGAGMGLALPAFAGELLPERTVPEAARGLVARHAGIVIVLAILAPVATSQLADATEQAILQGTSLVLDAQIEPLAKLKLAPALLSDVDVEQPRAGLAAAVAAKRADFAADAAVYDRLALRLDDVIVLAVREAFQTAYLIAAGLALVAAALLWQAWRRPLVWLAAALAVVCALGFVVASGDRAPEPVALQDPCKERSLPQSGGITGFLQEQALRLLDESACGVGATREELALALFDRQRAGAFEERYGVDPRSAGGLLSILGG